MSAFSNFRRITSTGKYIPEVDGIRFIACLSVVVFHASVFYSSKKGYAGTDFPDHIFRQGYIGVYLFFTLSGYILSAPFAEHLANRGKLSRSLLAAYFIRRLTRLEPTYIIALIGLFAALVWGVHKYDAATLLPHFIASLLYSHNIVYGTPSLINGPLWTLELEVQFYLLAPFLCYLVFRNGMTSFSRCVALSGSIVMMSVVPYFYPLPFLSLWAFFNFFLAGILVTEILRRPASSVKFRNLHHLAAAVLLVIILAGGYDQEVIGYRVLVTFMMVALFVLVLKYHALPFIFTNRVLCILGGACYSIYLIHYPVISAIGNRITGSVFSGIPLIDELLHLTVCLTGVAIIGMGFYKVGERPFMDKAWPQKLVTWFRSRR